MHRIVDAGIVSKGMMNFDQFRACTVKEPRKSRNFIGQGKSQMSVPIDGCSRASTRQRGGNENDWPESFLPVFLGGSVDPTSDAAAIGMRDQDDRAFARQRRRMPTCAFDTALRRDQADIG